LGGSARDISRTWKGTDVPNALDEMIGKVKSHPAVRVMLNAEIAEASGFVGNFDTTISVGGKTETVRHGALVVATGGQASTTDEYLYGKSSRVSRWHELEENIRKFKNPKTVVFIQCVGSRDEKRPYCSRICCTNSVQQAVAIKEENPDADVYILYRDMRTFGERERLYRKAREKGVIFIRYSRERKPRVTETKDGLEILVFDPVLQREIVLKADLLNLATAIVPRENEKIAALYKLPVNQEKFFMEAHAKLRPVDFASDGIFVCGLAHYPKPLDESISQAMAAVGRAVTVLSRQTIAVSPLVSNVDVEKCIGCGLCTEVCSFGAIVLEEVAGKGHRAVNIPASCKGCGLCAASCPRHAIDMLHFRDSQIKASLAASG